MARPTLPTSDLRLRRVVFRLTNSEHFRLSHRAAQLDLRVNDLARKLTTELIAKPHTDSEQPDAALLKELYYIGHNLNQITKRMHMTGRLSPTLDTLCHRIEELMDEAIRKDND